MSNHKKPSVDTLDLFTLPDFGDDDEDDEDYEPLVRKRGRKKAVALADDDDDNEEEEQGNGNDDDDEDYEEDEEDEKDDNEENEDEEDDDEKITLQKGKANEQRKKLVVKAKRTDTDVVIEEMPRGAGRQCANVEQVTEFRKYIKGIIKAFEEKVKKGKQVKKYLVDMIDDVREACMNMRYPG